MSSKQKRVAYTAKEKLCIVEFAEQKGNRAAGREYGVSESNIRLWRKKKENLLQMPKTKQANRGLSAKLPELERELYDWVCERRERGLAVSTLEIRLTAAKMYRTSHGKSKEFKASQNWCYNFMKRKGLSVRRRTTIAQKLPADHEEKLINFQKFIIDTRLRSRIPPSRIGNADQTPMHFDLPSERTVNQKGLSTVSIRTTGNEKNRFTVMLTCLADGTKLKPYVIFRRKTMPKGNFPKGVIVRVQEKGWMNTELTKDWLKAVWAKRPETLSRSLLVLDSFRAHRDQSIKAQLERDNTDLAIIPGGMTSLLQPLDVGVNKPYKVAMRKEWNEWMASDDHAYTAGGKMKRPDLDVVCQWLEKAWDNLDPEIIIKSFKKCGISNAMDGTEDDALWEDSGDESDSDDDSMYDPEAYPDFDFDTSDEEDFLGFSDSDLP